MYSFGSINDDERLMFVGVWCQLDSNPLCESMAEDFDAESMHKYISLVPEPVEEI